MNDRESLLILTHAPFAGCMPADIEKILQEEMPEERLATLFALVSNKTGLLHFDLDQNDAWTVYAYQAWQKVDQMLMDRIFSILLNEGVLKEIPKTGKHYALMPFMQRNGYEGSSGWWNPSGL